MCGAVVEFLLLGIAATTAEPCNLTLQSMMRRQYSGLHLPVLYHDAQMTVSVSSFKSRLAAAVCAKKLSAQRLQLFFRCICYNLLAWNDAKYACHVSGACHASLYSLGTECTVSYLICRKIPQMDRIRTNKACVKDHQAVL